VKVLGKLLCRFGFHRWQFTSWVTGRGVFYGRRCKRCGRRIPSFVEREVED
jgi:hypothetical protein